MYAGFKIKILCIWDYKYIVLFLNLAKFGISLLIKTKYFFRPKEIRVARVFALLEANFLCTKPTGPLSDGPSCDYWSQAAVAPKQKLTSKKFFSNFMKM